MKEIINKTNVNIAVVGCVHGDELIGAKVIDQLKKIPIHNGTLSFIIANKPAFNKGKRYFKKDLNRSFPGKKNGVAEEKFAYKLSQEIKKYDLVIDVHATRSEFEKTAIVAKLDKKTRQILNFLPVKKIVLVTGNKFGRGSLISQCKLGISLEYGFTKSARNYKKAVNDIKALLANLGLISEKKKVYFAKEFYKVGDIFMVSKNFKESKKGLKEFQLIKKGQLLGYDNKKPVYSKKKFIPLFLGKGKYDGALCLIAQRFSINN